ncbi:hypothetical protein JCM12681A_26680 [Streptomyces mexicanus]
MNTMPSTASAPSVISRARARRDGRPTLIRGPDGPDPRSGIWKAKGAPRSSLFDSLAGFAVGSPDRLRPLWPRTVRWARSSRAHTYATYSRHTRFPVPGRNEAGL